MTGISLTEYDPAASRQQLHGVLKVAGEFVAGLRGQLERSCPGVVFNYDPAHELLQVVFPEDGERAAFLRALVEVLDDYSGAPAGTVPELLETRLVAILGEDEQVLPFSRHFRLAATPAEDVAGTPCLRLEHGTSFGSGRHPSTRLAMAALDRVAEAGADFPTRVLDVGCGSGILALACGLLGAGEVLGVDIDARALTVAAENAIANGLADRVRFSAASPGELGGPYDLLVANITGAVMGGMVGEFARLLRPGGRLVISGLQGRQLDEMVETLGGLGFVGLERFSEGAWRAGLLQFGAGD